MRRFVSGPVSPVFFWVLLVAPGLAGGQEKSYAEMRGEVVELYGAERFEEAAALLQDALDRYPDHLMANCVNLALMNLRLGRLEDSHSALSHGLSHGIWYGKYSFLDPIWEPMKAHSGWASVAAENERARGEAAESVAPRLEVRLPSDYDPDLEYPLFLALHGGGENVDIFMPNWYSPILNQDFIVAFPQSTQLVAMDGYNWTEDLALSLQEVRAAYDEVITRYPVDESQVVVGGFSSGGVASLEVVLKEALPVLGFVVLCPAMPEGFSAQEVGAAASRGVRGTLLTTEMDGRVDQQQAMVDIMKEEGLAHEFHITPDIGHWYPDDLGARLDQALDHILKGG